MVFAPPNILDDVGSAEWHRIQGILEREGRLSDAFMSTMMNYALAHQTIVHCQERLEADGLTVETKDGVKAHPCYGIMSKAQTIIHRAAIELRITPKSDTARARRSRPEGAEAPPGLEEA